MPNFFRRHPSTVFQPTTFRCSCVAQTLSYTIKVGRAVALKLAMDGFDVVCCTSSDERFASLQRELVALLRDDGVSSASCGDGDDAWLDTGEGGGVVPGNGDAESAGPGCAIDQGGTSRGGRLLRAKRVDEGVHHRLWVVGKYDVSVRWGNPRGFVLVGWRWRRRGEGDTVFFFGIVLRVPSGAYSHDFSPERSTPTGTRGTNGISPPPAHPLLTSPGVSMWNMHPVISLRHRSKSYSKALLNQTTYWL